MSEISLIAYQNSNQDQLFQYYDNRNKTRLRKLKNKATITENQTNDLRVLANQVLSILRKAISEGLKRSLKPGNIEKMIMPQEEIAIKIKARVEEY